MEPDFLVQVFYPVLFFLFLPFFLLHICKPECPFWDRNLKPGTGASFPGLPDGNAGYQQNFPDKEEPETRIPPDRTLKNDLLFPQRYANPVSSQRITSPSGPSVDETRMKLTCSPCRRELSSRL
jgi:hypothetical protein